MKYFVLTVDPFGIPLRIRGDFARSTWPVDLSKALQDSILEWNRDFSKIIACEHLYTAEQITELRRELNERGFQLASQISGEIETENHVEFAPE